MFLGDKFGQSFFAKEYLLTCQEQACTRFTCFFGWLVVTKPKMAKNTGKCPLVITSLGETLLQKGPDQERGIIGQVSLLHNWQWVLFSFEPSKSPPFCAHNNTQLYNCTPFDSWDWFCGINWARVLSPGTISLSALHSTQNKSSDKFWLDKLSWKSNVP